MSWSIVFLEIFEVGSILILGFTVWKIWHIIRPFKRMFELLKMFDETILKHEDNKEKREKIIKQLRKELRKTK